MARVTVILYQPVITFMRGWNGDIGMAVRKLTDGMALGQRFLVSKNSKTGHLLRSISVGDKGHWARGIETGVGANPDNGHGPVGYALWNDQGTRRHMIYPRPDNRRRLLVFFWARVGHTVYLSKVNHPGNRPYDWVMLGAGAAMAAWSPVAGSLSAVGGGGGAIGGGSVLQIG